MCGEAWHAGMEPWPDFEPFSFEEGIEPIAVEFFSGERDFGQLVFAGVAAGALQSFDGSCGIFVRNEAAKRSVVSIAIDVLEGEEGLLLVDAKAEFGSVAFFFGEAAVLKPFGVPHVFQIFGGELVFHAFAGLVTSGAALREDLFSFYGISAGGNGSLGGP